MILSSTQIILFKEEDSRIALHVKNEDRLIFLLAKIFYKPELRTKWWYTGLRILSVEWKNSAFYHVTDTISRKLVL